MGLGDPLSQTIRALVDAVKDRISCRKRSWLNKPNRARSSPVAASPSASRSPISTTAPASSTFHGEKWYSGVKGVPYLAKIPSEATVATVNRNAIGNSRR
jgi:hypothetical protein